MTRSAPGMITAKIIAKPCMVIIWLKGTGIRDLQTRMNSSARIAIAMALPAMRI